MLTVIDAFSLETEVDNFECPFTAEVREIDSSPHYGPLSRPAIKEAVTQWCDRNCESKRIVGRESYIFFQSEDDLMLFKMAAETILY